MCRRLKSNLVYKGEKIERSKVKFQILFFSFQNNFNYFFLKFWLNSKFLVLRLWGVLLPNSLSLFYPSMFPFIPKSYIFSHPLSLSLSFSLSPSLIQSCPFSHTFLFFHISLSSTPRRRCLMISDSFKHPFIYFRKLLPVIIN